MRGLDLSTPEAPLFSNRQRLPLSAKCVNRWFRRWCGEAGLEAHGYTPHSARHGAGSLLGASGFSGFEISKYLGHADPRTTLQYVHASPEMLRRKLDELPVFGPPHDDGPGHELAELRDEVGGLRSAVSELVAALTGSPEETAALLQNLGETRKAECHPDA